MGTALLANNQQAPAISDGIFLHHFYNIDLLLAEFSVRTVNYGPSFFSIDLWPKHGARGP